MTIIKRVAAVIMVIALLAIIAQLSTPVSAQGVQMDNWTLTYAGAPTPTVGVPYQIHWSVSDGSGDNDPMPAQFLSLIVDGRVVDQPALPPTTASSMDATTTFTFTTPGTHTLGISIPQFISDDDGDIWPASSASTRIAVAAAPSNDEANQSWFWGWLTYIGQKLLELEAVIFTLSNWYWLIFAAAGIVLVVGTIALYKFRPNLPGKGAYAEQLEMNRMVEQAKDEARLAKTPKGKWEDFFKIRK